MKSDDINRIPETIDSNFFNRKNLVGDFRSELVNGAEANKIWDTIISPEYHAILSEIDSKNPLASVLAARVWNEQYAHYNEYKGYIYWFRLTENPEILLRGLNIEEWVEIMRWRLDQFVREVSRTEKVFFTETKKIQQKLEVATTIAITASVIIVAILVFARA